MYTGNSSFENVCLSVVRSLCSYMNKYLQIDVLFKKIILSKLNQKYFYLGY